MRSGGIGDRVSSRWLRCACVFVQLFLLYPVELVCYFGAQPILRTGIPYGRTCEFGTDRLNYCMVNRSRIYLCSIPCKRLQWERLK